LFFRFGISDYAAAALANGLLKDLGYITDTDHMEVVDPSKISREKRRICAVSLTDREKDMIGLKCIGLDSKRDANALVIQEVQDGDNMKAYRTSATVDNLTFTAESGEYCQYGIYL
jgi:hypothetical protein